MTYIGSYHQTDRSIEAPEWYGTAPVVDTKKLHHLYLGTVKDTKDPQRMGRLMAAIPELTGDINDPDNWFLCTYCPPFAGASLLDIGIHENPPVGNTLNEHKKIADDRTPELTKTNYSGQQSYGMWFVPPDIGNEIVIGFLNGDPARAVWFACRFHQDVNHMVPGIAQGKIVDNDGNSTGEVGPVIDHDARAGFQGSTSKRRAFTPLRDGLKIKQGLDKDGERGQSSSSAQRESPSEVFGILTPDGNSFVMDDGDLDVDAPATVRRDNELIRFRTKSGVQLLLHETKGFIYLITRDGKTWIELSNEGNVDVYSEKSVSVHALSQDINLKSGRDINIQAQNNINIRADGNIKILSANNTDINVLGFMTTKVEKSYDLRVVDRIVNHTEEGLIHLKAGSDIAINSEAAIGITATLDIREEAANIFMNSGIGPQASNAAEALPPPTRNDIPGPAIREGDQNSAFTAGPFYDKDTNINSRVPQHEPWELHTSETRGLKNFVVEADEPLDKRKGAFSFKDLNPLSISLPTGAIGNFDPINGLRLSNGVFNAAGFPEFGDITKLLSSKFKSIVSQQVSNSGLDVLLKFEGNELEIYKDIAGNDTIGVGHLITAAEKAAGTFDSGIITAAQSQALLLTDLDVIQRSVRGCLTQSLTQEQYDALISMAFNIGPSAFCGSTLVKKLNVGDFSDVPNEMSRWTKARVRGVLTPSEGLFNRRKAEAILFSGFPSDC